MARRISYEEVERTFAERGCMLLSKEYVKSKDKLSFICSCGRTAEMSFDKFKRGQLCSGCKGERQAKTRRHPYEYVKSVFEKEGCELLSETYEGNHKRMDYICECGKKSKISLSKLQSGQRCTDCRSEKISERLSGSNNYMYKPEKTDEERIQDRKYPEYYEWRKDVYTRDKYTCQCCGQVGGVINAHHIESYSRVKELRTSLENGVTLCEACHKQYHTDFYRNDADRASFNEFMFGDYRDPWYAG